MWFPESLLGIYILVCIDDVIHCLGPFHGKTKQGIYLTKFVFLESKPSQKRNRMPLSKTRVSEISALLLFESLMYPGLAADTLD